MNTAPSPAHNPYSARNSLKPINFFCNAPRATVVQIMGDFNQWRPKTMQRRVDGWWHIQLQLSHGHHQYRFLVDGVPTVDSAATGTGRDENGNAFSVIAVS